ncbi:Maf family protein [Tissierella creatinophila]|uniref:dTTP/UTP pyrophosphatase n=1 Tax=Tissierella creatinophila DSM 6911 TaxID=1123403 RepID=A0A1U7M7Q9_TISCR|nr:Maf family protein [Tissierella creatinophila]OLS03321.1 septum formation protein Maf [Tissierella creatinophila DSM 6911]
MNDIILASTSKRREEILKRYNFQFRIIKGDIVEIINKKDSPEELVMSLAFRKAYSAAKDNPKSIVIGADTVVVYKDEILSKPKNSEDAFRMLSLLNGKTHEVITGISILNIESNEKIVDFEKTKVKFRDLDKNTIDTYIATKEPFDKAGSYGIQDIGALLVEGIEGCYLNVVGLPLVKLDKLLNKFFDISIINMNK